MSQSRDAAAVAAMAVTVANLKTEIATFCGPAVDALYTAQRGLENHAKDLWLTEERRRTAP